MYFTTDRWKVHCNNSFLLQLLSLICILIGCVCGILIKSDNFLHVEGETRSLLCVGSCVRWKSLLGMHALWVLNSQLACKPFKFMPENIFVRTLEWLIGSFGCISYIFKPVSYKKKKKIKLHLKHTLTRCRPISCPGCLWAAMHSMDHLTQGSLFLGGTEREKWLYRQVSS